MIEDNGFCGGYLAWIEEIIKRECPKSDIKMDNNASYKRFKSWHMFDEWKDMFGKDRATSSGGRDLEELYHGVRSNLNVGNESQEAEFKASADKSTRDNETGTQLSAKTNGNTPTQLPKRTGKKRKLVDRTDVFLELLAKRQDETSSRLDKLANRTEFEFDVSKARKKVFGMLGNIQGITPGHQIDTAEFIFSKVEHLDLFNNLPEAFYHTSFFVHWRRITINS
ncbi:hypothetical protein SASPL_145565 [Salvia splendens]|uniref:No apical meristem-associated C-terminal domain-containing protein n=1 Tax=Salvia splendens TaxID=180675 RepID=A0A8X8WJ46_SALSN|nr:hypothetical protein SASPL_145565 [Salvia splendens]